jgi:hypothetical protein
MEGIDAANAGCRAWDPTPMGLRISHLMMMGMTCRLGSEDGRSVACFQDTYEIKLRKHATDQRK